MTIGKRLKTLREARGLSVQALAEASGVSAPYLWQIENGRKSNPSGQALRRLATALGTTVAELLGEPLEIPEKTVSSLPPALRRLVRRRGKALDMRQEDVEMLRRVHFRGRLPASEEDWELVFLFLKRLLG